MLAENGPPAILKWKSVSNAQDLHSHSFSHKKKISNTKMEKISNAEDLHSQSFSHKKKKKGIGISEEINGIGSF